MWANSMGPGLAMSRSLGDTLAHSVGVTYQPEIWESTVSDPILLATDGVWDAMNINEIQEMSVEDIS